MKSPCLTWALLLAAAGAMSCSADEADEPGGGGAGGDLPGGGKADSSVEAIFLDFDFDSQLVASRYTRPESAIETQLLYTIGHLNGDRSLGRLDKVELSNVESEVVDDVLTVKYHARMPVAWGKRDDVPETYTLHLPKDVSHASLTRFAEAYGHDCVDWGAHDVDSGSMWYYFRPDKSACGLDPGDVVTPEATVAVSAINTSGKYPEYHEVWKDGVLKVVAIFGKFEEGATENGDAGISGYNEFVGDLRDELSAFRPATVPEDLPDRPGVAHPDVAVTAELAGGRRVEVVTLLVDNVRTAGAVFDDRYEALSADADLISYSGHAGLGANIRALAGKGSWKEGQYVVVFMNGCDTYAYVDSALADAHRAVNADDPEGTKYVDIVTNAMPAPASQSPRNLMALITGLLAFDGPQTYEQMFARFAKTQVVLVSGEQDNVYYPGYGEEPPPGAWEGMSHAGTLAAGEQEWLETPLLPEGGYTFALTGTGDADLYVRVGAEPTASEYDCRPYRPDSNEKCVVELASPAVVHLLIEGFASSSDWELAGAGR